MVKDGRPRGLSADAGALLRQVALRSETAVRLETEVEITLLRSIVDATVGIFAAEAASIALLDEATGQSAVRRGGGRPGPAGRRPHDRGDPGRRGLRVLDGREHRDDRSGAGPAFRPRGGGADRATSRGRSSPCRSKTGRGRSGCSRSSTSAPARSRCRTSRSPRSSPGRPRPRSRSPRGHARCARS